MAKIKVLHIIKSLGRGGAEMLLPETLKLHDREKFEFHYIYFLPWKDQMVPEIEQSGGKVKCFNAANNISLLFQFTEIIKYCKNNNIDVIHCHLPWAGFLGRFVHKRTNIPVIYSEHNMQERYHFLTKLINRFTFNWQTSALAVSHDVETSVRKNITPNIRVRTLLNGVNTLSYKRVGNKEIRKSLNIPDNAFVVGLVAVFRFQKRIEEWLEVFKDFTLKRPNAYAIIVGAGPLEEQIKNRLEELNLEDRALLVGLQTNTKQYFEAMDVFMMTSSFEGLPIALLEAMSMECAIVSTNAGGVKEVIRDQVDGCLYDVNEWKKMSGALINLYDNKNVLDNLKVAARERVVEKFSLSTMVKELENEYLKMNQNDY